MAARRSLWFLVDHTTNNPVTFYTNEVAVSPYIFTHERAATEAVDDRWPPEASERLVARPGPPELFLRALAEGFQGVQPKQPDCFSLNSMPGTILGGLVPVTAAGAEFVDRLIGEDFWTMLTEAQLREHARDMVLMALGEPIGS